MFALIKKWLKERNRVFRTALQVVGASALVGVLTAAATMLQNVEVSDPLKLALVSVVTVLISSWMSQADKIKDEAEEAFDDACEDVQPGG